MKLLYTPTEVAAELGMSRSHIYHMLRDGQLESIYIGVKRRIPGDALAAFVADRRAVADRAAVSTS